MGKGKGASRAMKEERGQDKIHKVMSEFKHDALHTGSKTDPLVKSRKQAIAIAISESKKRK